VSAPEGIVKMLEGRSGDTYPGMDWEPKAAFTAVLLQRAQRLAQGAARLGERVLDADRNFGVTVRLTSPSRSSPRRVGQSAR
jgi:hypothetical protein